MSKLLDESHKKSTHNVNEDGEKRFSRFYNRK